jgi:hypothetical protein
MTSIETRRVGFLNWDSDEERERSRKGVAYRQKQKQQKMARRQQDIRNAEEVWNALIDPSKEGTISDFVRNNLVARVFFENFQGLFAAFRRSPLWGRLRNPRGPPYSIRDMLHYLHISGISFGELQQADTEEFQFLIRLMTIGIIPDFGDRFVSRPAVSATSSEDYSQDNVAGRGQRAAARRCRPRNENEDLDAPHRRRQRQE